MKRSNATPIVHLCFLIGLAPVDFSAVDLFSPVPPQLTEQIKNGFSPLVLCWITARTPTLRRSETMKRIAYLSLFAASGFVFAAALGSQTALAGLPGIPVIEEAHAALTMIAAGFASALAYKGLRHGA